MIFVGINNSDVIRRPAQPMDLSPMRVALTAMIRVERQGTRLRVTADGVSASDSLDLDRRAVRLARDRYLDHLDRLYDHPPDELEDSITWQLLPRRNKAWGTFRGYFLHAKLQLLLSDDPQPVDCLCEVDESIGSLLESICDEHGVQFHASPPNRRETEENHLHRGFAAVKKRFSQRFSKSVQIRLWIIYFIFVIFRPVVLNLYRIAREPVDVRFWLDPVLPQRDRFFDAPTDLGKRGFQVGFACYDLTGMESVRNFISRARDAVRTASDSEQPVSVEWYIDPPDFRRSIEATSHVTNTIKRESTRARLLSDSPDFAFLARQLEAVSPYIVFQLLFMERAVRGFAEKNGDTVWTHAQTTSKYLPRLLAIIGDREGITTVAVAPHHYSTSRVTNSYSDNEIESGRSGGLPDQFAVFEPRSATTLEEQGIPPERIDVAHDKVAAEAGGVDGSNSNGGRDGDTTAPPISIPKEPPIWVFVPLQEPTDDIGLGEPLAHASNAFPEIKFVIKTHPFFSPDGRLFEDLEDDAFVVAKSDASLSDLIDACDICVSVYSTATIPALKKGLPVVWVPFASPNHVSSDLTDEVGIRADDPQDFANVLEGLVRDETVYEEHARKCEQFAESELVPGDDSPTLADLLADPDNPR